MVEQNFNQELEEANKINPDEKPSDNKGNAPKPAQKALRIISNIISVCMVLIIAVLGVFLVQSKFLGVTPSVAGYQMYIVLSGSMNPEFDAGSVVIVKPLPPEAVGPGDVITFKSREDGNQLVTHRVVKVNEGSEGIAYTTKGDANDIEDFAPVSEDQLVGKMAFAIPYLGLLLEFSQTKQGLLYLILIPGAFVIIAEFRNLYKYASQLEEEKQAEEKSKEQSQA